MDAPLYQALRLLANKDIARFHMPGHKGQPIFQDFSTVFAIDYTETYETGNLYEFEGAIRIAEQTAAEYFGAADCHFLTGGSSQGIKAMLGAVCGDGGKILLDRNCHKSAMYACALFDLQPSFVLPDMLDCSGCSGIISIAAAEQALLDHPDAHALLIVSPNYYGVMQPIEAFAELCHRYGKKLLVDAAHGAHLDACGMKNPVALGADAAVLSAHKTLPALGQAAYLLLGHGIDAAKMRHFEAMCGTSSPSYLIMATLDLARAHLQSDSYMEAVHTVARLRCKYTGEHGFLALSEADARLDPLRFTIACANGHQLADMLYTDYQIASEMSDRYHVVFIVTPADLSGNLSRLEKALDACMPAPPYTPPVLSAPPMPVQIHSVRHALFFPAVNVPLAQAVQHICARPVVPYPPGVPLLWPGEEITVEHIEFLTERCYNTDSEVAVALY